MVNGNTGGHREGEVGVVGLEERDRLVVTVEQAGRLLGISRGLAYELARTGQIPAIRLGRRLVVSRARLLAMLQDGAPESSGALGGQLAARER